MPDDDQEQPDMLGAAEAEPEAPYAEAPRLPLGPPFAFSDAELLDRGDRSDGCFASVVCSDCREPFLINLLTPGYKRCPGCDTRYTTALVVAHHDNDEVFADTVAQVLHANGVEIPGVDLPDDDDDAEGDDGDDDQE